MSKSKVIKFRLPYTWLSHAVDCPHCRKSWLMDIDTTMTTIVCPYCGQDIELSWK